MTRGACHVAAPVPKEEPLTQHPTLQLATVRCSSCGAAFELRSTAAAISIEVCSSCHPAYTGLERTVVGGDRVSRFNRRRALAGA
jgi:large subunit ribosomal protein L31